MQLLTPPDESIFLPNNPFTAFPKGLVLGAVARMSVAQKISTVDLLALPTALQLVGAPGLPPHGFGSSLILLPRSMTLQYVFGATAYTLGNADNTFQVEYTGKSTSLIQAAAAGLVDQVVNEVVDVTKLAAGNLAQTNCANLGLELVLVGTTPALTLGDGALVLTLDYDVKVLQ